MNLSLRLGLSALLLASALPQVFAATENNSRLVNLSSRAVVGAGADVLIAGFVVGGSAPKDVLVRALGPTIGNAGVAGALPQLKLQVFDAKGTLVTTNEQWPLTLKAAFTQVGASMLADNSGDAAIRVTLPPGAYSAQVSGAAKGVALIEVYEMDGASRLMNLSSRARVEAGDGILISGLVISGKGTRRVLVRALGPSLADVGVEGALVDPTVHVFGANGALVFSNDNWQDGSSALHLATVSTAAGAGPLKSGSKDAAFIGELPPGIYSVHVRGAGDTNGVALLEAYDVTDITESWQAVSLMGQFTPYGAESLSWTPEAVSARLGPTWEQINPGAADDRPTVFTAVSKMPSAKYYLRIKPYELGEPGSDNKDYWSEAGQVGYVPDDPLTDPGLDRVQLYAYYNNVFAISPRFDWPSGKPHPDPQTREPAYVKLNGGTIPMQPVAMVRGYGMQQNEQVMVYRDGLFAVAGMQTSRSGKERPYPGFKFPPHKVPRAIAVTTSNEFALVTIWDTQRNQGQLAVIAMEGKYLPFHTWPYIGMPNQGSFSDFKLLGYIDLPMKAPDAIAAASNGLWQGPSSTDNKVLSQIKLSEDSARKNVYDGAWQFTVAKNGYAVITSSEDNKAAIVDLTPLFAYMRESWLSSAESFAQTTAARGSAPEQFPQTFDVNPAIMPRVVWQAMIDQPTAVLAGQKMDRWTADRFKAYIASRDGTIRILDTSSLMKRFSWEKLGELKEIGSFKVGRNPVHMAFTRRTESGLPLIPNTADGDQRKPDAYNNMFYVACRGERSVDAVVTFGGQGQVYRRIKDSRMGDPVAVSTAVRGNILTVADYAGKKIISFRMGTITDTRNDIVYPLGDPNYRYEFAGELKLTGSPFMVNSANVN